MTTNTHDCPCSYKICNFRIPMVFYSRWTKMGKTNLIHTLWQQQLTVKAMSDELKRLHEVQKIDLEKLNERIRYMEDHSK